MKNWILAVGLALAAASAGAAEHTIEMRNQGTDGIMVFEPGFLKANPGDTVTFVPIDAAHNTVSDAIPDGATAWNGAIDEKVTVKLDKEGIYLYKCTPHQPLGMVGVIQVGKPVNLAAAKLAADALNSGVAANKERLPKYMAQVK